MRLIRSILPCLLALILLLPARVEAQAPEAEALLNSMSPEERVGQLFLVTFTGTDIGPDSPIHDLVAHHHVGGVVLLSQNDNFAQAPDTVAQAHALIEGLQQLEWDASADPAPDLATGEPVNQAYIPLLVGLSQEGNGAPTDQVLSGMTPLPSQMAVGATWDRDLSRQVGEVRGRELSAMGVNLLFGPSLDVLETPSASGSDLGTRVFGGDPFWVGEMGAAYVAGLHSGSENRLLVIAKHFPGVGGSDRLPEQEVSTVRKSIEQLKQIELAPFFSVTGSAAAPDAVVDGLLVSHIRYQGLQGNIRATTRPISFDPQALKQILALPEFSTWYGNNGLVISDDLGAPAISDFYTSGGSQFIARTAARDAFLAGNDMIYLGNINSSDSTDTYNGTLHVIDFFAQKYREDPAFAKRVDESVKRILSVKFRAYSRFDLPHVLVPASRLTDIGSSADVTFDVARSAATLVSPDPQDLAAVMPLPPSAEDRMVFITDATVTKQCSTCPDQPLLAVDALQQVIIQLYGPSSGNQVRNLRLTSFSLDNLQSMLDRSDVPSIEESITHADWVVISLADASQGQPALVGRFLRERPDLLRNKHVILFSFGAPYYFDATTISKFTAYFALYSKQPQFVDVAARILFQELTPAGSSPVTIAGTGYDLISTLTPDPTQIIPLTLDLAPSQLTPGPDATPEPTPIPLFQIGNTIAIRTGEIVDRNGHTVPDGTPVQFSMTLTGEGGGIIKQVDAVTRQGVARAAFGLDKPGLLEIHVTSDPASVSEVLQLDVSQSGAVAVTMIVPELTRPVEPTLAPTQAAPVEGFLTVEGYPRFPAWAAAMGLIAAFAAMLFILGLQLSSQRAAIRLALGGILGGLLAYNFLAFGLFGTPDWLTINGLTGLLLIVSSGELTGAFAGWLWSRRK